MDLTNNLTPVPGYHSRMFGLGTEVNVFNRSWINIPVRVGLMQNIEDSASKMAYTAGTGLTLGGNQFSINSTQTFTTVQVSNFGIGAAPGTYPFLNSGSSTGASVGMYNQPTQTFNANSQQNVFFQSSGTWAKGTYTGLIGYNLFIGSPTVSGTGTFATTAQIYIMGGIAATSTYGIYQAGTDLNVFNGYVQFNNGVSTLPSLAFVGAGTTGLYWANPGVGVSVAGASVGTFLATGWTGAHNGTLGATTPSSAAVTTLTASSTFTLSALATGVLKVTSGVVALAVDATDYLSPSATIDGGTF